MLLPAIAFLKTRVVLLFFPSFFLHSKWPTRGKAAIEPLSYPPRPLHSLSFSVLTPSPPQPPAESGKQSSLTLFPFPIPILLLLLFFSIPDFGANPRPTNNTVYSIHSSVRLFNPITHPSADPINTATHSRKHF
jgi:hypothetical protein